MSQGDQSGGVQGRAPIGSVLEPVKGSVPVGKGKEDPSKLVRTPKGLEHEDPSPLYVVWEITLACDLGCRHCGSRAGDARSTEMSTEACLAAVEEMKELGVREVTLIGGEAYLREDWSQIARAITDAGMLCGITTGGQGFTQERVDEAVDAGIGSISVSIDGLERTHDAQRGKKGSFRMAREACERIARSPMRLATNTQINKLSMPELPALADLLVEMGSKAWQLQLTVPMGNAADRPDMLLQPYELLELFPLLVWIKETKITPNGIAFFPGNNIGYFGPYEEHLRYGGTKGAHWAGCGAGKWLPFLGSLVDDLLAIDCSQKLVERAKRVYGSPGRVTATGRPRAPCRFGVVDLTKDEPGDVERHDLVVSANVLIAPDRQVCEAILAATLKRVANGGFLVLLVPSHESARAVANVYMRHRLPQKKKLGRSDRRRDFTPLNAPEVEAQVWKRWGVRTQTYSLGALRGLLNVEGYDVERIQRVEYDWDTELDIKIPKAARPFDWLAVVRRRDVI